MDYANKLKGVVYMQSPQIIKASCGCTYVGDILVDMCNMHIDQSDTTEWEISDAELDEIWESEWEDSSHV